MSQLIDSWPNVGTANAKIDNDFPLPEFNGVVTTVLKQPLYLYLGARQKISTTETILLKLTVSLSIKAGRYELTNNEMIFHAPNFVKEWVDEDGAIRSKRYYPDDNIGYVDVKKIDIEKGIFEADFDVSLQNEGNHHQAIGYINATRWSE
ncbi:hypothetical protein [Pseudomonas sp. RT6P73]